MTVTSPSPEDPRAAELRLLQEQITSTEAQIASLPAQRTAAENQRQQQGMAAQQQLGQVEFDRQSAQQDLERIDAQLRQQLAGLDAQEAQFAAQRDALGRELSKPAEKLVRPREAAEDELEQMELQLGGLPAQRSALESQAMSQRAEPEERQRQLSTAEADARRNIAQADLQAQQQISALEGQEQQLRAQLPSLQQRAADLTTALEQEAHQAENEKSLAERTQAMEEELDQLRAERAELAQLVEASRDVASASGAEDLSTAYSEEATQHKSSWKTWLVAAVASVLLAGGGGTSAILLLRPESNATNAEIATALGAQLLLVGLLLYFVKVSVRQFSAHRHLEAVARSKAAALSTFNRMVAAPSEPEVRTAVASALAQAVFSSDETGFIDSSSEHVTLIERVAAPVVQRLSP